MTVYVGLPQCSTNGCFTSLQCTCTLDGDDNDGDFGI